jgi:hypothetical protein
MGSMRAAHQKLATRIDADRLLSERQRSWFRPLPAGDGNANSGQTAVNLLHRVDGSERAAGQHPRERNDEENDPGRDKHVSG